MMKITITRSGLATIGKRGFQDIGRDAIRAAAQYWWEKYLPLHFQNIAYRRYNFAARGSRTNRLKAERKPWPFGEHTAPAIGEVKPLVFTGRTRERLLSSPNIQAIAPSHRRFEGRVILDAPALNFSAGKRIDLRDEITRDTPQENKTLEKIFAAEWDRRAAQAGLSAPKQTKTIAV